MNPKKVSVIPADLKASEQKKREQYRVCAYCRVSTDSEEQQNSYKAQVSYYESYIRQQPKWQFAGVFADEGITGTNTRNRTEFNKMIEACKAGKIDLIITKSISRFARNTVDCLTYIRQLKEMNIPVVFEKENINTMNAAGEFIITLLGSLAQEESRNISTNVKWSIEKQFQSGKLRVPFLYGYRKNREGNLIIDAETAKHVKKIFTLYVAGASVAKIKDYLEINQVKSPRGKNLWDRSTIQGILANEKYTGDAILQKYYNPDFLTGKSKKNHGEVKKYYVKNSHPAIISKALYNAVQEERIRRSFIVKKTTANSLAAMGRYSSKYALTELLICGCCQHPYRRKVWTAYKPPKAVWRCCNRLEFGKKVCGQSPTLYEEDIHRALMLSINQIIPDKQSIITTLRKNIECVLNKNLYENLVQEIPLHKSRETYENQDDKAYHWVDKVLTADTELHRKYRMFDNSAVLLGKNRIEEIIQFLNQYPFDSMAYDDILIKSLIENITVLSKDKILVFFKFKIEKAIWLYSESKG